MSSTVVQVVIIGAGPYGLSIAAHLKARGVNFRIFGQSMQAWHRMPRGMYLKSLGFATTLYTPDRRYTFTNYCTERGLEENEPCPLANFARYGTWTQRWILPELEEIEVSRVSTDDGAFQITLATGEMVRANSVVVAVGAMYFAHMPKELVGLSPKLATHTSQYRGFDEFTGKDVCVIGAGQSALETAALLHEAGARPLLLVRGREIGFSTKMPARRNLWERFRRPASGLGPGLRNWFLETFPASAHHLPGRWRVHLVKKHLGPLAAWWLRDRVEGKIPIRTSCRVIAARAFEGRLVLRVREQDHGDRDLICDHVIAGCGYEVDSDRLEFLDPDLRRRIRRIERAPALNRCFESSIPGLFFVGLASSLSFGPLFRFVVGANYTARAISKELERRSLVSLAVAPARVLEFILSSKPDLSRF